MLKKIPIIVIACMYWASTPVSGEASGFLGIGIKRNQTPSNCLEIERLSDEGPAGAAGLEPGDIILEINGAPIDCNNLPKGQPLVPAVKANDRVVFGILRAGQRLDIPVVAIPPPPKMLAAQEEAKAWTVGKELFYRFRKTGEIFSITKLPDGTYKAEGQFSAEEAKYLLLYFEKSGTLRGFDYQKTNERVDMTVRWDPVRNADMFELANKSVTH